MDLNEYQKKAMETCVPGASNFSYMMLNLIGEVGELASKIAKARRKEQIEFCKSGSFDYKSSSEGGLSVGEQVVFDEAIMQECGDILWQTAGLCAVMGWSLDYVAKCNLEKLAARKKNGTIVGSGDGVTKEERNNG